MTKKQAKQDAPSRDIAIILFQREAILGRIPTAFSETITWEIVGEQRLSGFDQVLKHCQSIEHYFSTVAHEFHIQAIHQTGDHVIVQGEAQFHNTQQTSRISACDVYTFNRFESTGSNSILLYFNPIKILKNEQVQKNRHHR